MERIPKIGVGVIVKKDDKILFLQRKNSHGDRTWSFPGGHLEFNEEIEECAKREIEEETGIKVKNLKFETITNDMFKEEEKHYITIFMSCEHESGEPEIKEPEKCTHIKWCDRNSFPEPLFLPIKNLIKKNHPI